MRAQTVARRQAGQAWAELDALDAQHGPPERAMDATATRDMATLASAGFPAPRGNGRDRHYVADLLSQNIQDCRRAA